jgi:hypothetical protein
MARSSSSSTLLALCHFAAVALAAAAPRGPKVPPASNCKDSEPGMPSGWAPVHMVPDDVYGAIQLALVEGGNSTWAQPCDDPVPTLLAACSQVGACMRIRSCRRRCSSCPRWLHQALPCAPLHMPAHPPRAWHSLRPPFLQVVAGSNYQVVAHLSCPDVDSTVAVHAEVYVPLPFRNEEPEVRAPRLPACLPAAFATSLSAPAALPVPVLAVLRRLPHGGTATAEQPILVPACKLTARPPACPAPACPCR